MKFKEITFPTGSTVIVVAFDLISSSEIIEKLTLKAEVPRYFSVLGDLKHYMADAQMAGLNFAHYKFTGDGWILLFHIGTSGTDLLSFLRGLCDRFCTGIEPLLAILDSPPAAKGLTFGIDVGPIFRGKIFQKHEYVGRPIIVACRLQSAVQSAYKALASNSVFHTHLAPTVATKGLVVSDTSVQLKNINAGADVSCKEIAIL